MAYLDVDHLKAVNDEAVTPPATGWSSQVNDALSASTPPGSVSVGLAELRPGDTSESLVERADAELYRGRRAARSTSDADPLDPAV
ncbi:MAG: hypothetical protein JWN88_1859 [Frankiales bacterium]|nr:hypothetical protein [Frankiales bacterium]